MKVCFVDNRFDEISGFMGYLNTTWKWTVQPIPVDGTKYDPAAVIKALADERPDVVLMDVALTEPEEASLDEGTRKNNPVAPLDYTGMRYCAAIKHALPDLPIALYTKAVSADILSAAFVVRADRLLLKPRNHDLLALEIDALVRSFTYSDPCLFAALRDSIAAWPNAWEATTVRGALDVFYKNASPVRRLGLLCAHLCPLLTKVFADAEDMILGIVRGLVDAQALLSLVDRGLRDHVRHSGNVFWMGYYLLNKVDAYRRPQNLDGFLAKAFSLASPLFDQLNLAWMIASLFHDLGYAEEREEDIRGVVLRVFPNSIPNASGTTVNSPASQLSALRQYLRDTVGESHHLYRALSWMLENWNQNERVAGGGTKAVRDHGIWSAARLLTMMKAMDTGSGMHEVIMQAVVAMTFHNVADWHRYERLPRDSCGTLPLGTFPLCNLLALCDMVQTWDRESEADPAAFFTGKGLTEKLIQLSNAYIQSSEITRFAVSEASVAGQYSMEIGVRYSVKYAESGAKVCQGVRNSIEQWKTKGRAKAVVDVFGLSKLFTGVVQYEIPTAEPPVVVSF